MGIDFTEPPVELLPPELLADIFKAAQPERRSRYAVPFEVTVSHVSTRWRSIALDTPLLWTDIDIYSDRSLGRVSDYLERSTTCSIDVRFDIWQSDIWQSDSGSTTLLPIVDIVVKNSTRWRTLFVFSHYKTTTLAILSKMENIEAPILQRLRFVDDGKGAEDPPSLLNGPILTGGAPRLTRVQMDNIHHLPLLTNLTTLRLHSPNQPSFKINMTTLADLATAYPSLHTLSIHGDFDGDEVWPVHSPAIITMGSLRSLAFTNQDTFSAHFLKSVALPQLESLWLHCPLHKVIHTINHHGLAFPALKYLTLQSFDFHATSLFAEVFPTITGLYFPFCNPWNIAFLTQTFAEDDPLRWSFLDTLVFSMTGDAYAHAQKLSIALRDLVISRRDGRSPIKRLLLDKDVFRNLSNHSYMRQITAVEQLTPDNYDDPWWIISHQVTGDGI